MNTNLWGREMHCCDYRLLGMRPALQRRQRKGLSPAMMAMATLMSMLMMLAMALADAYSSPAAAEPRAENRAESVFQLLVAEMAIQGGDLRLAAAAYQQLSETTPDPRASQRATLLLAAAGDRRSALAAAQRWLALEPSSDEALASVDTLRVLLDKRTDLLASLSARRDAAAAAGPKALDDFYAELDGIVRQSDDAQRSLAIFDVVAEPHKAKASVRYSRALLLERAGQVDEMEAMLRALLQERPKDAQVMNALGYSLADRNVRLDEAQALIEKANQLAPGQAHIEDSMGWVAFRQGRTSDALKWLGKAHRRAVDPEIAAHYGEVLWSVGRREQAAQVWQEALLANPRHPALNKAIERLGIPLEIFLPPGHLRVK